MNVSLAFVVLLGAVMGASFGSTFGSKRRNVLLILSDDQRPALNWAYRQSYMHTPNLDRLAQRGFTFGMGYTQYAICGQSRNSFMSSRYPDSIKVYNFIDNFRNSTPGGRRIVSGPQAFKQSNYLSLSVGKLWHPDKNFNGDIPLSWSQALPYEWPVWTGCEREPHSCNGSGVPACSQPLNASLPGDGYSAFGDWFQKERIIRNIKYAHAQRKPFFLGVGFVRPHGAWQVPDEISNEYPPDGTAFNDTPSPLAPEPLVDIAFTNEFDGGTSVCNATTGEAWPVGTPTVPVPHAERMRLRQHYFSAVTLVDRFVGEVLDTLQQLGIENDTAVVFSADHGYQLGDHSTLGKHTLWEASTRIPAIFSVPWLPASHGLRSSAMYHAVDLFPTMQGLAGLGSAAMPGAEGIDQSPLLADPGVSPSKTLRQAVFSQYARCQEKGVEPVWKGGADMCTKVDRSLIRWMGYAVRTRDWHLIEWRTFNGTALEAVWTPEGLYAHELYDHRGDDLVLIGSRESKNVAGDPGNKGLVANLSALVRAQYSPGSPLRFQVGVEGGTGGGSSIVEASGRPPAWAREAALAELQAALYKDFVRAIVDDDEAYAKTVAAVDSFGENEGPKLHEALLAWDKANPNTSYIAGFWYDMYLDNRDAFPLNLTPQLSWKMHTDPAKNEQAVRAADLCRAAARFYVSYQNRTLLPDVFHTKPEVSKHAVVEGLTAMLPTKVSYYAAYAAGAYPLDMSQYARLFCSTRIPVAGGRDELRSVEHSSYAAVFVGTHAYKLQLFEEARAPGPTPAAALGIAERGTGKPENLRPLPPAAIEAQIRAIQADAAGRKPVAPVAALTTMHRDEWGEARASLEKGGPGLLSSLQDIDGALFALSLDDATPDTHEDLSVCMLAGEGRNRWFDKSFNIVVCANGRSGIAWEHAWGDGVAVLNFFNEVHDATSKEPARPKAEVPADLAQVVRRVDFEGMPADVEKAIRKAESDHDRLMGNCDIDVYRTPSLNKEDIKQAKLSPDGIMQMVLQLAHHKAHGYVPSTYESAATAGFKHGRTETIRSASPEAAAMVRCFADPSSSAEERVAALEAAVGRHSKTSRLALMGKGVDRHLFALRKHAELQGMDMPGIFTDESYLKMGDIRMSTSTLSSPALDGGGFGPVSRTSYGIGYGNDERGVQFHVASYGLGNEKFLDCIEESLTDLRSALEAVRGGPLSNRPETALAPGELRSKREVAKGL